MTQQKQPPIKTFRAGKVRASIWANKSETEDGTIIQHSVRIQKCLFNDKTKEWRSTEYFFPNDLPRLRLVADQAFAFITLRESDDESFSPET